VAAASNGLGSYMIVRWSAPLDLAALNIRGYVPPQGPLVDAAHEVLITMARSTDGASLDLVLEPMDAAVPGADLRLSSLAPDTMYRLAGDGVDLSLQADSDGEATVSVGALDRRISLRLEVA